VGIGRNFPRIAGVIIKPIKSGNDGRGPILAEVGERLSVAVATCIRSRTGSRLRSLGDSSKKLKRNDENEAEAQAAVDCGDRPAGALTGAERPPRFAQH